jgi:hypothetical protein
MFEPRFIEVGRIEMLLGGVLQSRVDSIDALSALNYDERVANEVIDRLRTAASHCVAQQSVDSRALQLFQGQWYDAPVTLTMGFPENTLVAEVIEAVGYGGVPCGHDHLGKLPPP